MSHKLVLNITVILRKHFCVGILSTPSLLLQTFKLNKFNGFVQTFNTTPNPSPNIFWLITGLIKLVEKNWIYLFDSTYTISHHFTRKYSSNCQSLNICWDGYKATHIHIRWIPRFHFLCDGFCCRTGNEILRGNV